MIKVYETVPDFVNIYGDGNANTRRVVKAFNEKSRTGGPFTKPV
jgi:hypothetical protein